MKRSLLAILLAFGLTSVSLNANACFLGIGCGNDDEQSTSVTQATEVDVENRNTNTNKAYGGSASAKAYGGHASQGQGQEQGQSQIGINEQGQYQGNVGVNKAVGTGNKTSVSIGGDTFESSASGGSVSNQVEWQCGGTGGGYVHTGPLAVGGGAAYEFDSCVDMFIIQNGLRSPDEDTRVEAALFLGKMVRDRRAAYDRRGTSDAIVVYTPNN